MHQREGTILVVDDESESLQLLTGMLAEEGYRVRPAGSGKLALAAVAAQKPDLILLDLRMPDMDGFEVCRQLKATEETRDIPLIFISSITEVQERVEGLALGAVDFVSKPFRRDELLARVSTHLELSRLRTQLGLKEARRTAELKAANERLQMEIAERRRAEHAVRESAARFQAMADTAPVGIWMTDPDGAVTFLSKNTLMFTGRTMEELTKNGWAELLHPGDMDRVRSLYSQAIAARRKFRIQCRIRRFDRQYRWVLTVGIPRFKDRVYAGHVGTSTDISDLRRSHERALAAQELKGLKVLAAGIAHDFNVLLGAIIGQSDVALLDLPLDSPARDSVEKILTISRRAAEIVRLLIAYARGRGEEAVLEPVSLSLLVKDMLRLLRVSIPSAIVFETSLADQLPAIPANAAQIRQIVLNLIMNAAEALEGREGRIIVTTKLVRLEHGFAEERWQSLPSGTYACLTVSESGRGMAHDVPARLFDPFHTAKSLGHGLGLAAVQGILRAHGGAIEFLSTPGGGATFEVLLPSVAKEAKGAVGA